MLYKNTWVLEYPPNSALYRLWPWNHLLNWLHGSNDCFRNSPISIKLTIFISHGFMQLKSIPLSIDDISHMELWMKRKRNVAVKMVEKTEIIHFFAYFFFTFWMWRKVLFYTLKLHLSINYNFHIFFYKFYLFIFICHDNFLFQ